MIQKIRDRKALIAVIGLGQVGLATAAVFANSNFKVIGVDIKREIVDRVSSGKSFTTERELNELVRKAVMAGKLTATTGIAKAVEKADIIIVCVQTPLNERKGPNTAFIEKACEDIAKRLSSGALVVIQSTVPPETTKNVVAKTLEQGSGLTCGEDFWLAHCPERLTVGKAVHDFTNNVRIVGGYDLPSSQIAAELFEAVTKGQIVVTDCTSAEMAKLAENAFRYVNIAFANELALISERYGVDVMEVIELANTHPRVDIHKPGCGVGGPCLPKDTYLLLHTARRSKLRLGTIECSIESNESMPRHTIELLVKAFGIVSKDVKASKIVVLGSAYRGEVAEARDSPARDVIRALLDLGADVVVYDPYCEETFGAKRAERLLEAVKGADCLVIATDHQMFRELKLEEIKALMNENPAIIDGRRVINPTEAERHGFRYYGIGHGS